MAQVHQAMGTERSRWLTEQLPCHPERMSKESFLPAGAAFSTKSKGEAEP